MNRLPVPALALALTLVACSAPESPVAPPAPDAPGTVTVVETAATTPVVTPTTTGIPPLGSPDTTRKENWSREPAELTVTGFRIGEHDTFDRLVFDLQGTGAPGWIIDYTEQPLQQASGLPVEYTGTTALQIIITGTPYPFEDDADLLAHGPHPGGGVINDVTFASLFEAHSEFVVGLNAELPYSVTFLEDPKRLVIDLIKL